jgi:hypothetical protein
MLNLSVVVVNMLNLSVVMVNMLNLSVVVVNMLNLSVVDRGFESGLGQTKDYKMVFIASLLST